MPWWQRSSMKMLAEGQTLSLVCQLLYKIKSAIAANYQMLPPVLTVGEANSRAGKDRVIIWILAVLLPSLYMGSSAGIALHVLYTHPSFSAAGYPWCLPSIMLWGVYMALVTVVMVYMDLYLPNAPVAVRDSIVNVGWCWVGLPVALIDLSLVYFGQAWMVIALVCLLLSLIALVFAFWAWLVRTYSK